MSSPPENFSFDKTEYSFLDNFLYYGLFIGAIFQLACILAVVFIPKSDSEKELENEVTEQQAASVNSTPRHEQHAARKTGKHERKKRR